MAAVVDGEYLNDWKITGEPLFLCQVNPGVDLIERFLISDENNSHLTAFVFCDMNNNGRYDEVDDWVTGFKPGKRDANDNYCLQIGAYY